MDSMYISPDQGLDLKPRHDYYAAFRANLHLLKLTVLWLGGFGLSSSVAVNNLGNVSPEFKEAARLKTNSSMFWIQSLHSAFWGDSIDYSSRFAPKPASSITTPNATAPTPPSTALAPTTTHSGKHTVKRHLSSKKKGHAESVVAPTPEKQELSYEEKRQNIGVEEGVNWARFIDGNSIDPKGARRIKGKLTNTASIVTYRKIVLHVIYHLKDGSNVGEDITLTKTLMPNSSLPLNEKVDSPPHTDFMTCTVTGANFIIE